MMERFRTFLAGYKTYLTAASAVLLALVGYASGEIGVVELFEAFVAAAGLASLRAGITTEAKRGQIDDPEEGNPR